MATASPISTPTSELAGWVRDARERTLGLAADLSDEQWMGPRLPTVNPLLWEIGHVGWFQERWALRHAAGQPFLRSDGDSLYDSSAVPHDTRWELPLPSRAETLAYLATVLDQVLDRLENGRYGEKDLYFVRLAVFHEDMHGEAFAITRQTLSYPAPALSAGRAQEGARPPSHRANSLDDATVPGGTRRIGADGTEPFVFDNEKWAHDVHVAPFSIARDVVTEGEFSQFVEDGGYVRRDLWTDEGWAWRTRAEASRPVYWRREGGRSMRRQFDRWVPLEPGLPVEHVNAHEAEAFCRWSRRRLPSETEWEVAASDAAAHGLRSLRGSAWQWTSTTFQPYPGFVADPYKEYSAPWFGTHRVLRGGSSWTPGRLLRNTWRNFYTPDRRDIRAGFRTCALD